MPYFCIFDHPAMPLVRVQVEAKRRDHTRDDFRLRYVLDVSGVPAVHTDEVIRTLDRLMGKKTKAHGVYQARYAEVRAAYDGLLDDAKAHDRLDLTPPLRAAALILAVALALAMAAVAPIATFVFLLVSAVKRQSGFAAMAEAAIVWSILDWRPAIRRLITYSLEGRW